MNRNNTLPISSEGFKKIGYLIALLLLVTLFDFDFLQFIIFISLLATLWVFRNPERSSAYLNSSDTALSICDGRVIEVSEENGMKKVRIQSSYMDIGLLRSPFEGSIEALKIVHGAHLSQNDTQHEFINERASYQLKDSSGRTIFVDHLLHNSPHRIDINTFDSQKLQRSMRYGFMLKGESVISFPNSARISVSVGDEVLAGESILAYL